MRKKAYMAVGVALGLVACQGSDGAVPIVRQQAGVVKQVLASPAPPAKGGVSAVFRQQVIDDTLKFFQHYQKKDVFDNEDPMWTPFSFVIERKNFLDDVVLVKLPTPLKTKLSRIAGSSMKSLVGPQSAWEDNFLTEADAALVLDFNTVKISEVCGADVAAKDILSPGALNLSVDKVYTQKFLLTNPHPSLSTLTEDDKALSILLPDLLLKNIVKPGILLSDLVDMKQPIQNVNLLNPVTKPSAVLKDEFPKRDSDRFFMLMYKYNIPPIKPTLLGVKYGFARLASNTVSLNSANLSGVSGLLNAGVNADFNATLLNNPNNLTSFAKSVNPINAVSIFPTNQQISINRTDTTKNTFTIEPKWAGVSAASYALEKDTQDQYPFQLPTVVGTMSKSGEVAWTYYPAKAQPIMLGTFSSIAVISVHDPDDDYLQVQTHFDYQLRLLKALPFVTQRKWELNMLKLDEAISVDELTSKYAVDLPTTLLAAIKSYHSKVQPTITTSAHSSTDYITVEGKVYPVCNGVKLKPLN
jgi:hypothetical protein